MPHLLEIGVGASHGSLWRRSLSAVRVTLSTRQLDGIFPWRKQYFVDCIVLFSEEEKAIIHERGLGQRYFPVGPETPPPSNFLRTASILLQVFSPLIFLAGCVGGCGMAIAGNSHADGFTGFMFLAAVAMYLTGFATQRHIKVANRPQQVISLSRLLGNPRFSIYAFDNATAKAIDSELRGILANIKAGLLENARISEPETFEL
jgi:hypothetical protein